MRVFRDAWMMNVMYQKKLINKTNTGPCGVI